MLMNKSVKPRQAAAMKPVLWVGGAAAVLLLILRVTQMPLLRDSQTGRFAVSLPAIAVTLAALLAMALLCRRAEPGRVDIAEPWVMPLALTAMLSGLLLGISGLWDLYNWALNGVMPAPEVTEMTRISTGILALCLLFAVLGAAALIAFGLQVASEGGTRIGMSTWPLLAPVLWVWLRLARYEMSYASAVGLSECYYDFMMFIFELLFLFKLARFVSGIGNTRPGSLLFFAMGAAIFSLSGPLTRLSMFLLEDSEAYLASELAGMSDFAVGALALVVALALPGSAVRRPDQSVGAAAGDAVSAEPLPEPVSPSAAEEPASSPEPDEPPSAASSTGSQA